MLSRSMVATIQMISVTLLCSTLRNVAVSKTLSLVNILYLPLSKYSLSVFRCRELNTGESVLRSFPDIVCASSEHQFFLAVGSFGLACYMVRTTCDLPPSSVDLAAVVRLRRSAFRSLSALCCSRWTGTGSTPTPTSCSRSDGSTAPVRLTSSTTGGCRSSGRQLFRDSAFHPVGPYSQCGRLESPVGP